MQTNTNTFFYTSTNNYSLLTSQIYDVVKDTKVKPDDLDKTLRDFNITESLKSLPVHSFKSIIEYINKTIESDSQLHQVPIFQGPSKNNLDYTNIISKIKQMHTAKWAKRNQGEQASLSFTIAKPPTLCRNPTMRTTSK